MKPLRDGAVQSPKQRIPHLDLLESMAIYLVLFYHGTLYDWDILQGSGAECWISYFLRTLISASIPIFFLVNGYLLFSRPFDWKKHLKKTGRFVFLAFFWTFVSRTAFILIGREPFTLQNLVFPILNLTIEGGMNIYWYLGALVCVYLIFPVLKTAFDANQKAFVWYTAVCAFFTVGFAGLDVIVTLVHHLIHGGPQTFRYPFLEMFDPLRGLHGYTVFYFCAGGLVWRYEDRICQIPAKKRNAAAVLSLLLGCCGLFGYGVFCSHALQGGAWNTVWNGLGSIFSVFIVLGLYLLSLNYRTDHKLIRLISANTLGIYLLHSFFYVALTPMLKRIPAMCHFASTVAYAALVLLACVGISLLTKKIPVLRKLL